MCSISCQGYYYISPHWSVSQRLVLLAVCILSWPADLQPVGPPGGCTWVTVWGPCSNCCPSTSAVPFDLKVPTAAPGKASLVVTVYLISCRVRPAECTRCCSNAPQDLYTSLCIMREAIEVDKLCVQGTLWHLAACIAYAHLLRHPAAHAAHIAYGSCSSAAWCLADLFCCSVLYACSVQHAVGYCTVHYIALQSTAS